MSPNTNPNETRTPSEVEASKIAERHPHWGEGAAVQHEMEAIGFHLARRQKTAPACMGGCFSSWEEEFRHDDGGVAIRYTNGLTLTVSWSYGRAE